MKNLRSALKQLSLACLLTMGLANARYKDMVYIGGGIGLGGSGYKEYEEGILFSPVEVGGIRLWNWHKRINGGLLIAGNFCMNWYARGKVYKNGECEPEEAKYISEPLSFNAGPCVQLFDYALLSIGLRAAMHQVDNSNKLTVGGFAKLGILVPIKDNVKFMAAVTVSCTEDLTHNLGTGKLQGTIGLAFDF